MSALREDEAVHGLVVLRDIVAPGSTTTKAKTADRSKRPGRETSILRVVSVSASQLHEV
ncbi:MAG: hypothetical protein LUC93_07860 [Planctomycetaceae bacterium]|nr:hypothetical protein [Planctomycetaceae bacterium]